MFLDIFQETAQKLVSGYTYSHMNKHVLISATGLIIVAGIAYYFATVDDRNRVGSMVTYEETAPENTSMGDGDNNARMANDVGSERKFLEQMIPHHQEAVDSAEAVLDSGKANAEVNALARSIISAQEKEIADMKSWYKAWYGEDYVAKDTYTPMMRDLTSLTGVELDKAFLEDMIAHHTAALLQGQAVAPTATHPETITLVKAIAESQSNEIITMRMILKQLPQAAE